MKYGTFVAPGQALRVEVELAKETDAGASFKAAGYVGDAQAVQARVELAYFNLADRSRSWPSSTSGCAQHNRAALGRAAGAIEVGGVAVDPTSTADLTA